MAIDQATVAHIANLARIQIDEADYGEMAADLSSIMGWIDQLGEVDTAGVPPLTCATAMGLKLRVDAVAPLGTREAVLANAPEQAEGFFVVPKVVE